MAALAKEVDALIDAATSQSTESSTAFAAVCDIINSSPDGPKEAEKCFRARMATQNPSVVKATLHLLDYCVKNCGMRFHMQIFNREFLVNLVQILKPKNNPTKEIQTTLLASIQRWAISYQGVSELREVCKTYEELLNKHIEFPPRDPDQISQIYIMGSATGTSLAGPGLGGDRRASTRSTGMPEVCTVYEVEPSSATLCPTGTNRRKSVDPRFPHKNTLNPSGRSPSRDRSPGGGPGGVRRGSYIATVADTDPRASGQRKQSFVIISNE